LKNKKRLIEVSLIIAVFLIMIVIRVGFGSYKEFKAAEKFYEEKNTDLAIIHYDRAIHWYTPFNPYVKASVNKLKEIGQRCEAENNYEEAVETYEILRSSIYSTRSFYTPFKSVIGFTDEKIAALRASLIENDPAWNKKAKKPTKAEILAKLKQNRAPSVFFSVLASIGFIGWIASVIFFILGILATEAFTYGLKGVYQWIARS